MLDTGDVKYAKSMKNLGWTIIVLSIVFFGVATATYEYLMGTHLGTYWGGILIFVTGAVAASSKNRCCVVFGIVASVLAIIVGIVALYVSASNAATFTSLGGCYNADTGKTWGTSQGREDAIYCATNATSPTYYSSVPIGVPWAEAENLLQNNYHYGSFNSSYLYAFYRNHQCMCADENMCYGYDLAQGNNCGNILTHYTAMIVVDAVLLAILLFATFVYSIYACCSARSSGTVIPTVTVVEPVQVQMVGAQVVYVQPGMAGQPSILPGAQYVAQYAPLTAATDGEVVELGDGKFV